MIKRIIYLLTLLPVLLYAGTTGKLVGKITDAQNGEPLIGANILLMGTTLGAATGIDGTYVILNIPPGNYNVRISFIGYESVIVEEVRIIVDQTTVLDLALRYSSLEMDEVVITAETPLIRKDMTSTISVVTREQIEALPVTTFTELLQLQAGVIGSGSNLHVRGGRSNEVAYLIDGMIVKDPLLGGLATQLNNDAIQEMTLLSGTFNAEYGNALSGIVNIVTRDGSDYLSGRVEARTSEFGLARYSRLRENRVNASISGPIFTKNLKYFISVEQDKRGSYLPFGYNKTQTFFTKLTSSHIPSMKMSLSTRGSSGKRQNYSHRYKYIPEQYLRIKTDSWQNIFNFTHTVANNLFYDVRISYFNQGYYRGIEKDTADYLPVTEREYISSIGNGFEFFSKADPVELTDSRTSTIDIKTDMVWQINRYNEIKTGFQFKTHRLRLYDIYDPKRNFPYINDYFTEPFEFAAYIQDKIEMVNLVINLGLRYDYVNANVSFRNNPLDPNSIINVKPRYQFSPRVGIAHPISDRTKLHFAYGHFFQNPDFQFLFENNQYDLNVREPLFGQPNLDAQRTVAYEVGLSHQFSDRVALHLTAYYKDVTGLIGTRYFFPFEEGRYTGYTLYVNEDYANMKGFEVNLDMRPDRYFFGGLTYTYSVAKGNASSQTEHYPGTQKSTLLYYLDFDKTHVFNASGTFRIPEGEGPEVFGVKAFENMDFSIIARASTGYPYTPGGRDVSFVVKNSLRMPPTYSIDLRVTKDIEILKNTSLRLYVEALNLTDRRNVLYVYNDTGEPDATISGNYSDEFIKDPSNFGPPRIIRIGFGINF